MTLPIDPRLAEFMRRIAIAARLAVVLAFLGLVQGARADDVIAGHDLFLTKPGTYINFADNPIPADFFDPGSEPFAGQVALKGAPLGSYPGVPTADMDTVVQRKTDAALPDPFPSADTVDIEVVALSLESVEDLPIAVGSHTQRWHVSVSVSQASPSTGSMTITHQNADGGVFDTAFFVRPYLTFTRTCDGETRTLDLGGNGVSFALSASSVPWQHTASTLNPAFPPLTSNLFPQGDVVHDSSGAGKHTVEARDELLAPGEAFYRAGTPFPNGGEYGLYKVSRFHSPELILNSASLPPYGPHAIAFAPSGLLFAGWGPYVWRVNTQTGGFVQIATIPTHVGDMAVSPVTNDLYVVSPNCQGGPLYRLSQDGVILDTCSSTHVMCAVAVAPNGDVIVGSNWDLGTVRASFDGTGTCVLEPIFVYGPGQSMAYSSNGNLFDTGGYFGEEIRQFCQDASFATCTGSTWPWRALVVSSRA